MPLRALLDSNIYAAFLIGGLKVLHIKLERLKSLGSVRICGLAAIRRELKDAPKKLPGYNGNYVIDLLRLYDGLVDKDYEADERMEKLVQAYFLAYKGCGGGITEAKLSNDFLIVACASLKGIDVVVSDDKSSMLNAYAKKAYDAVNGAARLAVPRFLSLQEFTTLIERLSR